VDDDLVQSSSNLYVGSGMHPLLSYENILSCAQDFGKIGIKDWSATVNYQRDAVVKVGTTYYRALAATINQVPASTPTVWKPTTLLSAYLRKIYTNSSTKMLHALFSKKKLNEASKQLLGNVILFEGQGNISKRIDKSTRFVGLKLTLKHPDTIGLISKIGIQVDTPQPDLDIYLYHTSSNTPIHVWTLNQTNSVKFQWHDVAQKILAFVDDEVNAGGHYYIGYYETVLVGQAIAKEVKWDGSGCSHCTEAVANRALYDKWGKFLDVQPFYVNAQPAPDGLWDEDQELYVDDTNFGLNFQMAVQCDVTRIMLAHSNALADVMAKQLTVDLLTELMYSMRDNQLKQKVAAMAAVALDNQENGQMGAVKILQKSIEAVDFDLSNLSPVCNPCNDGNSAYKKRSVWR
jgi:hypothetical protein